MRTVFVFSFNRGAYLKNCMSSIARCHPGAEVVIYDDDSNDPETLKVLDDLSGEHLIIRPSHAGVERLGGLYRNMQAAFESVTDGRDICFLQDDMQMIRRLDAADMKSIEDYFDQHPDAAFQAPVFLRGTISARRLAAFQYSESSRVYSFVNTPQICAGMYFSAVGIIRCSRLQAVGWQFRSTELENEFQAQQHFSKMGYMRDPFAMWLPNASAFRFRRKTLSFRLAEHYSRSGLYPLTILDDAAVADMRQRNAAEHPIVVEKFLTIDGRTLRKPWPFSPLKVSRLLRRLNEFETFIERVLAPVKSYFRRLIG